MPKKDAGKEYAEIWGEAVHSNRHLRVLSLVLGGVALLLAIVIIRLASLEPPRPIVVRVDEVGRAEALAYDVMEAQADPLDPTTKYFLNRFIHDFYSRQQATVEEHWSRSLRFLTTELANAAFRAEGRNVALLAAGGAKDELRVERVVLRIQANPEAPHGATADFDLVRTVAKKEVDRERWSLSLQFPVPGADPARADGLQSHGHRHHLSAGRPGHGDGAAPMIEHLRGREKALEQFGWRGREAEWIALVCLHSGVFTRAQFCFYFNARRDRAHRFVQALVDQRFAVEADRPIFSGGALACRIFSKKIYRALGAEDIRHRKDSGVEILWRRLLSLDYVLEHPGLPWLPTEPEKVGCFEALGLDLRLLPHREYRSKKGTPQRRYFALKFPVAVDAETATFAYVDPGHGTDTGLRTWGEAHWGLWQALRGKGLGVRVVAIGRDHQAAMRAKTALRSWANGGAKGNSVDPSIAQELKLIERAVSKNNQDVLRKYGGLNHAIQRHITLGKLPPSKRATGGSIDGYSTWRTSRLSEVDEGL